MEGGSEIVALQVVAFEIELSERMGAIHDGFDSPLSRHFTHPANRHNLPRNVDFVCDQNQLGFRRNRTFKGSCEIVDILGRNRNLD